jgi:choline kinase
MFPAAGLHDCVRVLPSVDRVENAAPVRQAIILAAGCGRRLRAFTDLPKGLVQFGSRTLVESSILRLAARGVSSVVIVTGYRAECYETVASGYGSLVELVHNPHFATTGTLESLRHAASAAAGDCLIIESDIAYESCALDACLASPSPNATVVSGRTGAGDEVWVTADERRRLISMSKRVRDLDRPPLGEFVGITKLSRGALEEIVYGGCDRAASYETDGLALLSSSNRVQCCFLPTLRWGEIDDERQVARVRRLHPAIARSG